jgi:cysteine desulfurase
LAQEIWSSNIQKIRELRDYLEQRVLATIPRTFVNGHPSERLPHVSNVRFEGRHADELLLQIPQLAASTGSACNTAAVIPSHVLLAMGLTESQALASVRFSLGPQTSAADIARVISLLQDNAAQYPALG